MFDIYDELPVGIDLGTTNSCICFWDGKEVRAVPNRIGEKITPSVIYLYKDEFIIGENILKDLKIPYECDKIYSIKRILGQDYNDEGLQKEIKDLHYDIVRDNKTNKPLIKLKIKGEDKYFTPEELSSLILKKLVKDAEIFVTKRIEKVVISVPAYFDDAQRNATIEAAKLAGLDVIRIINEPTAAALSYGLGQNFCPIKKEISCFSNIFKESRHIRESKNSSFCLLENNGNDNKAINIKKVVTKINENEKGKNIMVFDLGGGTFDLAILGLNLIKKEYEVKSKYSDKHLGGDDFDNKLVEYCLNTCNFGISNEQIDKKAKERLKRACEYAKKVLSRKGDNIINRGDDEKNNREVETLIRVHNFMKGKDLVVPISKTKFENEICKDLFDRLSGHFDELLYGAKLKRENIDEVILVGGSTRMPKIKQIIKQYFNCKINDEINLDEVVAYGATIQAAMLLTLGRNNVLNGVKLFDITPISLGTDVVNNSNNPKIKALGNQMSVIIPKWTKIPTIKRRTYETVEDNQESMEIYIFEGENEYLKYNKLLDKFSLINLPKKPKGQVQCEINFQLDENNILTVTAYEKSSGQSKEIRVISSKATALDNNKSLDISSNFSLNDINYEKKKYEQKVEKLIKYYIDSKNNEDKIKALEIYNNSIKEKIKNIINEERFGNINENNIEKVFFYVYQLLESLDEILYLNKNEEKEKSIIIEIKKYIDMFQNQSTYYIKEIINLFRTQKGDIFYTIFLYSIQTLNKCGLYYYENLQKHSRYYAKLYFEEVIKLYKKYINKDELNYFDIMEDIAKEKEISELKLQNINSNAVCLLKLSNHFRRLIDPAQNPQLNFGKDINDKSNGTGFTYIIKNINVNNQCLEFNDYNLILDEINRIYDGIESELQKNIVSSSRKELIEEKGICLGNMAKIQFIYQGEQDFKKYRLLIENSLKCAELCNKNNDICEWYKEALNIKKEIEIKMNNTKLNNEEIMSSAQRELDKFEYLFHISVQRFIDHILLYYPYDGYEEDTRPSNFNWEDCEEDKGLIAFLKEKYNPDNYPNNTVEEKITYNIILDINKKLNSILENLNK